MENDSEEETGWEGGRLPGGGRPEPCSRGEEGFGRRTPLGWTHVADFRHLIYNSKEVASSQVSKCQGNY